MVAAFAVPTPPKSRARAANIRTERFIILRTLSVETHRSALEHPKHSPFRSVSNPSVLKRPRQGIGAALCRAPRRVENGREDRVGYGWSVLETEEVGQKRRLAFPDGEQARRDVGRRTAVARRIARAGLSRLREVVVEGPFQG